MCLGYAYLLMYCKKRRYFFLFLFNFILIIGSVQIRQKMQGHCKLQGNSNLCPIADFYVILEGESSREWSIPKLDIPRACKNVSIVLG